PEARPGKRQICTIRRSQRQIPSRWPASAARSRCDAASIRCSNPPATERASRSAPPTQTPRWTDFGATPWLRARSRWHMRGFVWCLVVLWIVGCASSPPLPAKAVELNDQGTLALRSGDLETASARFEVALEYNPRFVEALTNLGLVELQRGNFDRAGTLLRRARRLNPDVAQPHHGLGVLEERRARRDRASKHYQAALAVDPGFAPARANLARLYFNAGDLER